MLQPSPAAPSGSALQFLKVSSAWPRVGSTLVSSLTSTPPALRSTRNSEISASRPVEPVRAATTAKSAIAPSGHRLLDAVERAAGRGELDRLRRRIALRLRTAPACRSRFARGDLRQPLLLLRVAARNQQRFGCEIDRRGERHRRQRAAHFLRDHAKLEMARACAAEFSGIATPRKPISARPFHNSLS